MQSRIFGLDKQPRHDDNISMLGNPTWATNAKLILIKYFELHNPLSAKMKYLGFLSKTHIRFLELKRC